MLKACFLLNLYIIFKTIDLHVTSTSGSKHWRPNVTHNTLKLPPNRFCYSILIPPTFLISISRNIEITDFSL